MQGYTTPVTQNPIKTHVRSKTPIGFHGGQPHMPLGYEPKGFTQMQINGKMSSLLLEDCKRIIKHPDARAVTPDLTKYSTLAEAK